MKILTILEEQKKDKKLSYSKIARKLGISRQNLNYHLKNLKNERITFSIEQIKKICEILEIDVSNFFNS